MLSKLGHLGLGRQIVLVEDVQSIRSRLPHHEDTDDSKLSLHACVPRKRALTLTTTTGKQECFASFVVAGETVEQQSLSNACKAELTFRLIPWSEWPYPAREPGMSAFHRAGKQ